MMKIIRILTTALFVFLAFSCGKEGSFDTHTPQQQQEQGIDSSKVEQKRILTSNDIVVEKQFLYDKYTLENFYTYNKSERRFQWDKIIDSIFKIDTLQQVKNTWGILKNRQNINGEAPLVKEWERNAYKRVADTYGVERFQGIPLYSDRKDENPERYGLDGSLTKILGENEGWLDIEVVSTGSRRWSTPKKYVKILSDTTYFDKIAFVDRTNQNIATLEKGDGKWLVRSMNPATTGIHNPPYAHETPLGVFVLQEQKEKMIYLNDGSSTVAGYAPYASRFSNGGYIHGVPTNNINAAIIEYSSTLGTIPRSHMCVRNASSHAEFVYDWLELENSLVIVIE